MLSNSDQSIENKLQYKEEFEKKRSDKQTVLFTWTSKLTSTFIAIYGTK